MNSHCVVCMFVHAFIKLKHQRCLVHCAAVLRTDFGLLQVLYSTFFSALKTSEMENLITQKGEEAGIT